MTKELIEFAKQFGLTCIEFGSSGAKIQFVGFENNNNLFKLIVNWQGDVIIENFEGCIKSEDFCEIVSKLTTKIKELSL